MKQEAVIKVSMKDAKSRSKAMQIVVCLPGVESVSLQGEDKGQLQVKGDGFDVVTLTNLLRKSVGYADIVTVGPLKEEEEEEKKDDETTKTETELPGVWGVPQIYMYDIPSNNRYRDPSCTVM